jgi:hypothetical protein
LLLAITSSFVFVDGSWPSGQSAAVSTAYPREGSGRGDAGGRGRTAMAYIPWIRFLISPMSPGPRLS